jgi:hypothetical protein
VSFEDVDVRSIPGCDLGLGLCDVADEANHSVGGVAGNFLEKLELCIMSVCVRMVGSAETHSDASRHAGDEIRRHLADIYGCVRDEDRDGIRRSEQMFSGS